MFGYSARERAIFRFWDGRRTRAVDPLAVQRTLLAVEGFDPENDAKRADLVLKGGPGSDHPEALAALFRVVDATRRAFGVLPFREWGRWPFRRREGLTDAETLGLFAAFGGFLAELQEDARPLASSPGHTASATGGPATESSAVSGSTVPP